VHGVSPTPDETAAGDWFSRWVNGKVAMAWMGPWDQATFWDAVTFDWDIMPAPASPRTGESVTWLASAALCISPDSKNKDAAYALAEFLCMDREAQTFNYESGQAVPNIVSMAKNEFLAMDRPPQNRQIFLDIIEDEEKGRFKPTYYTEDNTWSTYFWTESSKVWSGGMRAADFCRAIQPDMQERLDSK
jgi:multiple sugar transport system substrate-binding protein